jgi:hypothetical protein
VNGPAAKINPWAAEAEQTAREQAGATLSWRYGFEFDVARLCEWNKDYSATLVRIGSSAFNKAFYKKIERSGYVLTDEDRAHIKTINMRAFVEGVMKGWRGVVDAAGQPMAFGIENAMILLTAMPSLYADLREFAETEGSFVKPDTDGIGGNS